MAQRKVTAIPATITKYTAVPIGSKQKRRVAGYARVSTDHEDQVTSYEAQVDYYTNYIEGRDDWEFVAIYTDEGISATNTKRREGFKAMVPAILILTLAWTLSGVCREEYLNIGGFVSSVVKAESTIGMFMPAVFFLIALGLAFATGTSWGTFSILIPIAIAVFGDAPSTMLIMTVAACLSGAVCGDHISPISDTTILASAGAQCNHIDHVSTQMPYALMIAAISFVGFLVGGVTGNDILALGVGVVLLVLTVAVITARQKKKA